MGIIERNLIKEWADFLRKLKSSNENGESLLDNTMVFLSSNLGNASNHNNKNMPVLFAGGGFKHGQHLAFDQNKNYPLTKLFVSSLQRLDLELGQRRRIDDLDRELVAVQLGVVEPRRS